MKTRASSTKNHVFIATSIDGYIADTQGSIDWLHSVPNPTGNDMGYSQFISTMDALVMGRNTFEVVHSFPGEWPYTLPVFVCSKSLETIPEELKGKVFRVEGSVAEVTATVNQKGYQNLYIDGAQVIQQFLAADAIDEITQTIIPVVLGSGIPLFGATPKTLSFQCVKSERFLDCVVQNTYLRNR